MTQFNPTNRMPRPRFTTTLPSGPSVGLQQAGIPDPVMGSSMVDRQLQGALGDLTQAVGIAGNMATRASNERERADAKQKQLDEDNDKKIWGGISRGLATDIRENFPGDLDAIKKGTLAPTAEDQNDPELFLERLATERTIDVPEQFRERAKDHFKNLWANRGLNALYAKRDADQANAKKVAFGGLTDNLLLLDDPSKITATMNEAAKTIPGADTAQLDTVASKAMFVFARDGNEPMVKGFQKMLGTREIDQQAHANDLLKIAKGKQETERNQTFANEAAAIREEAFNTKASPETVKAQIEASAKKYGIERRYVEDQVAGVNAAITRQRDEEAKRLAYEGVANEIAVRNFVAVNSILNNAGDATTPQTGLIQPIDFQPIPGLPPELGGEKAQMARFVDQARGQTQVDLSNLDETDGVNVNRWTRYVRAMAGTKVEDDYIKTTLLGLDFGTTDKEGKQVNSPQNERAIRTYVMVASINPNYAADMVKGNPQVKKVYDSVMIDLLTPGSKVSPQIINTAIARGRIKPEDEARPGTKEYEAILKAAPNLTPALQQYAVRTYNEQKGKAGALEYAVKEAQGRGVQLWQSWLGWANVGINPLAPFVDDNNAPSRPLVDLGTLATEDASVRPEIGTAMESLLEERAKEINKLDPTLKTQATDLSLNYIGNGVWEVEGIKAGGLDDKYDNLFFVTDAQVRSRVQKNADTAKVEPLAQLESKLAKLKESQKKYTGQADMMMGSDFTGGSDPYWFAIQNLETTIKVRRLQESKKNP